MITRLNKGSKAENHKDEIKLITPSDPSCDEENSSSSATLQTKKWGGTSVPNDGTVITNIYVNTNLTHNEVKELIQNANLPYIDYGNGYYIYAVAFNPNTYIALVISYTIENNRELYLLSLINYATQENTHLYWRNRWEDYCFTELEGIIQNSSFNTISELEGMPIGTANSSLNQLFSITPFEQINEESIQLSGEYDGSIIKHIKGDYIDLKPLINNKQLPSKISVADSTSLLETFLKGYYIDELELNLTSICDYMFYSKSIRKLTINHITPSTRHLSDGSIESEVIYLSHIFESNSEYNPLETLIINNVTYDENASLYFYGDNIFYNCLRLKKLVLNFNNFKPFNVATIVDTGELITTFSNSSIANGTGYIYIPDAKVEEVKALDGWSIYASQIKPLSEFIDE